MRERQNVAKRINLLKWSKSGGKGHKWQISLKSGGMDGDVFFVGRSVGDVTCILLRLFTLEIDKGRLQIDSQNFNSYFYWDRGGWHEKFAIVWFVTRKCELTTHTVAQKATFLSNLLTFTPIVSLAFFQLFFQLQPRTHPVTQTAMVPSAHSGGIGTLPVVGRNYDFEHLKVIWANIIKRL